MQAVATQWKHDEIAQLEEYLAAPVVALVDVSGIPARQMMEMRKSLRERGVRVRMSRNRLLRRAIEAVAARRPSWPPAPWPPPSWLPPWPMPPSCS